MDTKTPSETGVTKLNGRPRKWPDNATRQLAYRIGKKYGKRGWSYVSFCDCYKN